MSVSLYQPQKKGSAVENPVESERLNLSLMSLFSPHPFSDSSLDKIRADFGDWLIENSSNGRKTSFTVGDFLHELTLEKPSTEFRRSLAVVSSSPKSNSDLAVSFFNLSRFCEIRAAMSAASLPEVSNTYLAAPNSKEDRAKADLTLDISNHRALRIQVKARKGKENRIASGIPTLRNVLLLGYTDLKARVANFINEHLKRSN